MSKGYHRVAILLRRVVAAVNRQEERHGFAGTLRTTGGVGGHFGAGMCTTTLAKRHGSAGARQRGGDGGHFEAPIRKDVG